MKLHHSAFAAHRLPLAALLTLGAPAVCSASLAPAAPWHGGLEPIPRTNREGSTRPSLSPSWTAAQAPVLASTVAPPVPEPAPALVVESVPEVAPIEAPARSTARFPEGSLIHDFDASDEGWKVVGGAFETPTSPAHDPYSGFPGGMIQAQGGPFYWAAPPAFVEAVRGGLGKTLTFDTIESAESYPNGQRALVLSRGDRSIYVDAEHAAATIWTHFSFPISTDPQWKDAKTKKAIADSEFLEFLAGIDGVLLRGHWNNGQTTSGLDNVRLLSGSMPIVQGDRIVSAFDGDEEQWQLAGGNFGFAGTPTHADTGGSLGGEIHADGKGPWYFMAPTRFLGNVSGAYGNHLSFDLSQSGLAYATGDGMIELIGGGHRLRYDHPSPPSQHWSSFCVRLHESESWYVVTPKGGKLRASEAQLRAVLADLGQLAIRGWYSNGEGTGGLDNVQLELSAYDESKPALVGPIEASFDQGLEGWTIGGGTTPRSGRGAHEPSGYGEATAGKGWYWCAPAAFRGNLRDAYRGTLQFRLKQSHRHYPDAAADLVILEGGGYRISITVADAGGLPGKDWTDYTVELREQEPWHLLGTRTRVDHATFRQVLANLQQLKIRGWFSSNEGTGSIDSVRLEFPQ